MLFFWHLHVKPIWSQEPTAKKKQKTSKRIFNHGLYSISLEYNNALNFSNRVAHSVQNILRKKKKKFTQMWNSNHLWSKEHSPAVEFKCQRAKKRLVNFPFLILPSTINTFMTDIFINQYTTGNQIWKTGNDLHKKYSNKYWFNKYLQLRQNPVTASMPQALLPLKHCPAVVLPQQRDKVTLVTHFKGFQQLRSCSFSESNRE